MNKTVTINLSGIIFHIDEDAYGKLNSYLNTIRGYFSESDGRDEIMADIENRIAEMLSEKVSDRKQVVLMTDVDYVISVMGKPEDFAGEKAHSSETKSQQTSYSATGKRRRVFRDTDNKILGGVCSGIGNYFNIDPLWLRLALVVCFFTFGVGFLLYIVLWIVIPEAKTSAEKLEMHGEDVNISNIGKKVEEEMKGFGKKMESWGEEAKQTVHDTMNKHRDLGDKIVDFFSSIFGSLFKAFAKVLGVFFIILGLIILVCIVSSVFGGTGIIHINNHSLSVHEFFFTFFDSADQITLASLALLLVCGIPLVMLVYGGVKMLLGVRGRNRIVNFSAGILWLIGVALAIYTGLQVGDQFAEGATSKQIISVSKSKCDTLFLRMKEDKGWNDEHDFRKKHFHFSFRKHHLFASDSSNLYFGYPTIDIVKSENDSLQIVMYTDARGKDRKEAMHFAHNVNYEIMQKDSMIEFNPYFSIPRDVKWRNQQVHVEVQLPRGKTIYIAKSMNDVLDDVQNETDTWDGDMGGRRWKMDEEELRCLDCSGIEMEHGRKIKKHIEKETSDNE